jgi:hypothetical protein
VLNLLKTNVVCCLQLRRSNDKCLQMSDENSSNFSGNKDLIVELFLPLYNWMIGSKRKC